jgi:hypothetical protein
MPCAVSLPNPIRFSHPMAAARFRQSGCSELLLQVLLHGIRSERLLVEQTGLHWLRDVGELDMRRLPMWA